MKTIQELLIEEMRDTYSSETQILAGLGDMAEAATAPSLKQAFLSHQKETKVQIDRLNEAFKKLGVSPEGNDCEATQGLVAEAKEVMEDDLPGEILDVALIMCAQKVEHYEIASYGSLMAIAKGCDQMEIAKLLEQTLTEEKATNDKLTKLAEGEINVKAFQTAKAA